MRSVQEARASAPDERRLLASNERAALFGDVIAALEAVGHKYCVMHGYSGYPEHIPTDVDVISEAPAEIPRILVERRVASAAQVLEHEAGAFYYVLHREVDGLGAFLTMDASPDFRRDGRIFLSDTQVFASSRFFKSFRAPSPEVEFAYCFSKRIGKRSVTTEHLARLTQLFREAPEACSEWLSRLLPPQDCDLVMQACRSEDWSRVCSGLWGMRRRMLLRVALGRPLSVLAYWAADSWRRLRRLLFPTGLVVAFIGPDGVGKTAVAAGVETVLAPAFRSTKCYHLRPHLGRVRRDFQVNANPHAQLPRGAVLSAAKMVWWWFDCVAGFLADIFPRLVRSTLVIFDRYYDDILVDPMRYRYGGPMWLAQSVLRFALPRRPVVVYLDAPVEVIHNRKREVLPDEISRQREAYMRLVRRLPNGHVIDAVGPIDKVVAEVARTVLAVMKKRTASRLGLPEEAWKPGG